MSSEEQTEYLNELKASRAEFEHRLRQLNDIVERNGGAYGPIAEELSRVRSNLKAVEHEVKKVSG